jgi:hypothetical protein
MARVLKLMFYSLFRDQSFLYLLRLTKPGELAQGVIPHL